MVHSLFSYMKELLQTTFFLSICIIITLAPIDESCLHFPSPTTINITSSSYNHYLTCNRILKQASSYICYTYAFPRQTYIFHHVMLVIHSIIFLLFQLLTLNKPFLCWLFKCWEVIQLQNLFNVQKVFRVHKVNRVL